MPIGPPMWLSTTLIAGNARAKIGKVRDLVMKQPGVKRQAISSEPSKAFTEFAV
jgi:hypothetical protein